MYWYQLLRTSLICRATLATDKVDEPYDLMWARITEAILTTEMTALSGFID